ncbi:hypothetical protein NL529_29765, partial [Klebsiella pneumoniae]|nr:hypothetical protein [Klebsiella pneumoniae]
MRKYFSTIWATSLLLLAVVEARAALYSGYLDYTAPAPVDASDGLFVAGGSGSSGGTVGWLSGNARIDWTVTDTDSDSPAGF